MYEYLNTMVKMEYKTLNIIICFGLIYLCNNVYTQSFIPCPLGCCSGGGLVGTSACEPYGAGNCSCESSCVNNGTCCHNYYETCNGESCPPFPTWLDVITDDTLTANNTIAMGDTLSYYCKEGYSYSQGGLDSVQTTRCVGPNGDWETGIYQCTENSGEDNSKPAEGEFYYLIAAIMAGAVAFQVTVFCCMDTPEFLYQANKCTKYMNDRKRAKERSLQVDAPLVTKHDKHRKKRGQDNHSFDHHHHQVHGHPSHLNYPRVHHNLAF